MSGRGGGAKYYPSVSARDAGSIPANPLLNINIYNIVIARQQYDSSKVS
jgi:hypothetical protein